MHIILIIIESEAFREFIYVITSALNDFMISSATIIRN
jgi:hypothetical protein